MTITKYVHSCLYIEHEGIVTLTDPGDFSMASGLLHLQDLKQLDFVVITHEHFDHFHRPTMQQIIDLFPNVRFVAPATVCAELQQMGATSASSSSVGPIEVFSDAKHAYLPWTEPPDNIAVHIGSLLTHPGDRHDFTETKDILALPVTAPWGSMAAAAELAIRLRPKVVVPIHDWHWNEQARAGAYATLEQLFAKHGIAFIKPIDGQPFSL